MAVMILITTNPVVFAAELPNEDIAEPNGPQYQYKTEYFSERIISEGGYAANQLERGIYLTDSEDAIHYTVSAGVQIPCEISVELPEPFDMISFSVSGAKVCGILTMEYSKALGSNAPGFYLLYVTQYYRAKPYVVYKKRSGAQYTTWTIDHTGCVTELIGVHAELVYMGATIE